MIGALVRIVISFYSIDTHVGFSCHHYCHSYPDDLHVLPSQSFTTKVGSSD